MKRKFYQLVSSMPLFFIILLSCNGVQDRDIYTRLLRWDAMIDSIPEQISDSLKTVNVNELSSANNAYYGLLETITNDKNYVIFTNDSLITSVRKYYEGHDRGSENHIRSLVYQGIVRTRLGVSDSTVYEPLKLADHFFEQTWESNPSLGYLVYYFLGDVHFNNQNFSTAKEYFDNALYYAKQENDSIHLLDTYLALFWEAMVHDHRPTKEAYLDTISEFYEKFPQKDFFILNAQSAYYDSEREYENALTQEKKLLLLNPAQSKNINLSRIYYNISSLHQNLEQLDSAMFYAQIAIDQIEDTTNLQNYIFYENVANIAEKQNNYLLANNYRKRSNVIYRSSIKKRLDTQIIELEKQYDLSEAENAILRFQKALLSAIIVAILLVFLLVVVELFNRTHRRKERMKLLIARHEAETQALQTKLLTEEAIKRKWLIELYGYISNRLTTLQDEFEALSQRYVSSNPKIYKSMNEILHKAETKLREIPDNLTPDAETFFNYTHIDDKENLLNPPEKLLLMLLSCNADNKQIATFMNSSVESIRVRKSQLKKKMTKIGFNVAFFNT